jgi:poly(3-hydroxyoctanoate) depolymerase
MGPLSGRSRRARAGTALIVFVFAVVGLVVASPGRAEAAISRCQTSSGWFTDSVSCPHWEATLWTGATGLVPRDVHYMTPIGTPPPGGWPAVIVWSPSIWSAEVMWYGTTAYPAGAYYDTMQVKALLDAGYAVLAPESHLEGFTFWDTNNVLTPIWDIAPDKFFTDTILSELGRGRFGMSSGGYMASRMAVSYPGVFEAIAVQSASYMTCAGLLCSVPSNLSSTHAPTLFLHGTWDAIVPISTMYQYRDRLRAKGVETRTVTKSFAGHEFLPQSPTEIVNWFRSHDPGA